jgi:hypothetical protein
VLCPECGSQELGWQRSAGLGEVYSTTVVRGRSGTHNVALVDLDEGFRMMSRVDGTDPAEVRIADRVAFLTADQDGEPIAVFAKTSARPSAKKGGAA